MGHKLLRQWREALVSTEFVLFVLFFWPTKQEFLVFEVVSI